jgi:PAS domain S-box-containing protein
MVYAQIGALGAGTELLTSLASNIRYGISRLRAMAALAASEELFRTIAENASDIVLRGDNNGVIQWISPSVESVLGWAPHQLVGLPLRQVIHPDDLGSLEKAREDSAAGGRVSLNLRLQRANGTYRWMSASGHVADDEDGVPTGFVSGWRDVREWKLKPPGLPPSRMAASEERYRLIAENALDVVVQANSEV